MPYKDPVVAKAYRKAHYEQNKDRHIAQVRLWQSNNSEKLSLYRKTSKKNNADKIKAYNLEYNRLESTKLRNRNRQRTREQNDPNYRIARRLRTRFFVALKKNYKAGSAIADLGCPIDEFRSYIAAKFVEGMSWDNHGEWHLDHIVPLAAFDLTNREDFLKAAHYTNYQPLWAADNIRKGAQLAKI